MKIIGHRGAKGLAPENTLKSVLKALNHNVDEIEVDVRATKDGIIVLHHDEAVVDASGNKLIIKNTKYMELMDHKKDLARLDQAIELVNKKTPLHIEIKPGEPASKVIKIIKTYLGKGWKDSDFLIASYDLSILLEVKSKLPDITRVVIERWSSIRATKRAKAVDTKRLSMNQLWLWSYFISSMSKSGWQISAYPLNSPSKAKKWLKYGLYGVVTDFPDQFEN